MDFPAPNEGQFSFVHSVQGATGEVICTLGFISSNGASYTQADNDAVADAWADNLVPLMTADVSFLRLDTLVGAGGGVVNDWTTISTAGGLAGSSTFPPNVSYLVNKHSGQAGRRNSGRMFPPGVAEGNADDSGILTTAVINAWQANLLQFVIDATAPANVVSLAILHPAISVPATEAYTLEAAAATPINELSISSKVATQRRRLRD